MKLLETVLNKIEFLCQMVAALLIITIMLVVFSDVLLRYLLTSPLAWAYDVINLYLMAGLFFLALSYTYTAHAHIGVDILLLKFSTKGVRVAECLTCLMAGPLFALMAKAGFDRAYGNWVNGDVVSGPIPWPTWVGPTFMAFGAGLLVLRLAYRLIGNGASLLSGRNIIAPLPVGTHAGAE